MRSASVFLFVCAALLPVRDAGAVACTWESSSSHVTYNCDNFMTPCAPLEGDFEDGEALCQGLMTQWSIGGLSRTVGGVFPSPTTCAFMWAGAPVTVTLTSSGACEEEEEPEEPEQPEIDAGLVLVAAFICGWLGFIGGRVR